MPRPRSTARFPTRRKVKYAWLPASDRENSNPAATTNTSADLLAAYVADVGAELPVGTVIERIIGNLSISTTTATGDGEFTCGIRVATEGITTVGLPVLDTEVARWLWWMGAHLSGAYETSAGGFIAKEYHFPFDVHGRWRMDDIGDMLLFAILNHTGETAFTWSLWTRTLVRIP